MRGEAGLPDRSPPKRPRDPSQRTRHQAQVHSVLHRYRAARHFVEESECVDVLVDSLISKVNELRSSRRRRAFPCLVRLGRRLPVQGLSEGSLGFLDRLPAERGPGTGLKLCHQGYQKSKRNLVYGIWSQ